jgi:pimeloyl-ACP methyl ester carboxylesterase
VRIEQLPTGAEARIRNEGGRFTAVLVNGGTTRPVPGTWSATSELLAGRLAPRFPRIRFLEVRYRVKTWRAVESCVADARAALELVDGPVLLVGFSLGGAVAVSVAGSAGIVGVLGLAPWLPPEVSFDGMHRRRFDVVHGAWDRALPGVPGVSPTHSRAGWERARRLGVDGTYTLIARGLHGCAVRSPRGGVVRLPRWRAWVEATAGALERFSG